MALLKYDNDERQASADYADYTDLRDSRPATFWRSSKSSRRSHGETAVGRYSLLVQPLIASESLDASRVHTLKYVSDG
jgi:hypothetical protein